MVVVRAVRREMARRWEDDDNVELGGLAMVVRVRGGEGERGGARVRQRASSGDSLTTHGCGHSEEHMARGGGAS
jgi:hypothetical protein